MHKRHAVDIALGSELIGRVKHELRTDDQVEQVLDEQRERGDGECQRNGNLRTRTRRDREGGA